MLKNAKKALTNEKYSDKTLKNLSKMLTNAKKECTIRMCDIF